MSDPTPGHYCGHPIGFPWREMVPVYLLITLHDHPTIERVGLQAPDDLATRDWQVGDTFTATIVGRTQRGHTEGIDVR